MQLAVAMSQRSLFNVVEFLIAWKFSQFTVNASNVSVAMKPFAMCSIFCVRLLFQAHICNDPHPFFMQTNTTKVSQCPFQQYASYLVHICCVRQYRWHFANNSHGYFTRPKRSGPTERQTYSSAIMDIKKQKNVQNAHQE